jgi:hypothetical protein
VLNVASLSGLSRQFYILQVFHLLNIKKQKPSTKLHPNMETEERQLNNYHTLPLNAKQNKTKRTNQ